MPTSIQELIATQAVICHFQPVVSVKKRAVVGLEALARGQDGPVRLWSPDQLFSLAEESSVTDALDDLCVRSALKAFAAVPNRADLALFLNLDASRLARGPYPAGAVRKATEDAGLRPQDVVLEFSDLDAAEAPGLRTLVETCQSFGFAVALDDLDGSPECLRRVAQLRPNVVKADTHLLRGIANEAVQQTLLQSIATLARRMGALTVAEGVENEDDANMATDLGADLLQGFHYGRPLAHDRGAMTLSQAAVERSAQRLKAAVAGRTQVRQRENERHLQLLERLRQALALAEPGRLAATLEQFVNAVASLECLYVLDGRGLQQTPTIVWRHQQDRQRSRLFVPAVAGADHSLKDYYLALTLGSADPHVSDPYVSLATGNLCRTLTTRFTDAAGDQHILCMDTRSN